MHAETRLPELRLPGRIFVLIFLAALLRPVSAAESVPDNRLVIGPDNIYLSDGVIALKEGDPKRAVKLLEKGLQFTHTERNFTITLSNIRAAYVLMEEHDKAVTYCTRALEINPNFWRAFNNRALAHLGAKRFPEADADIQAGLALSPTAASLTKTRQRYEEAVNPVFPLIIIDDRKISN